PSPAQAMTEPVPAAPEHRPVEAHTPRQSFSPPQHPASPATIQKAIEEVTQILVNLRETLDEMEEVLEVLELAERQKDADEREIESLRRALRNLQRPREGGAHSPRPYP